MIIADSNGDLYPYMY